MTRAKYKVGVRSKNLQDPFNLPIEKNNGSLNEVEFCLKCLEKFGIKYDGEKTRYHVPKFLDTKYKPFKNQIIFHISARMKDNQMSFNKLKEIMQNINIPHIFITAEPKDFNMAEKLEKETQAKFIKTDSFLAHAGLLKNAKLLITLEGGAMHLGPAVGTTTIALFGQSIIDRWYPWGYKNLSLQDPSKKAENISTHDITNLIRATLNDI